MVDMHVMSPKPFHTSLPTFTTFTPPTAPSDSSSLLIQQDQDVPQNFTSVTPICCLFSRRMEKVNQTYSPKWFWTMVMYHDMYKVKNHLKQIQVSSTLNVGLDICSTNGGLMVNYHGPK